MREIKFRAWCLTKACWHYFALTDLIIGRAQEEGSLAYEEWGEYTGLKDKNGREIYEGDIVRYGGDDTDDLGVWRKSVGWYVTRKAVVWEGAGFVPFEDGDASWFPEDCEVLGNIHENPELLEIK